MELGLVGLGRMGEAMRTRLRAAGHTVVGYDPGHPDSDVATLPELVARLTAPRTVWLMVPAGEPTRQNVAALAGLLAAGDLVIDGGNSRYTDDAAHAALLGQTGIGYLDCGVSGGTWGLRQGYAIMCGGPSELVEAAMPLFDALRPEGPRDEGFCHVGPTGAGHYAKMVHNGIEYGLMAALGEGYDLLAARPDLVADVAGTVKAWRRGTVVRSWLLDLLIDALADDPRLERVSGYSADSGEGRWCVEEAIAQAVPVPVIAAALFARFDSRRADGAAMRAVAALRGQFGSHPVLTPEQGEQLRRGEPPRPAP